MTDNKAPLVFYLNGYTGQRISGTSLARVTVKDEKVVIYSKVLQPSKKTGVLYEHLSSVITYSTQLNTSGVKYLKVEKRIPRSSTEDVSLHVAAYGEVLWYDQFLSASSSLEAFLSETISSWFNLIYEPNITPRLSGKHYLLFPSLASIGEGDVHPLIKEMYEVHVISRHSSQIAEILRTSVDVSSALRNICGDTVQGEEDVLTILNNPELYQFADLELGMTISEFVRSTPTISPLKIKPTRQAMKFLLANLTGEKKKMIVSIVQDANNSPMLVHELNAQRGTLYWRSAAHFIVSCFHLELTEFQRKAMAEEVSQYFTLPVEEVVGRFADSLALTVRFRMWMAENVLEPAIVSEVTIEEVDAIFHELLAPECDHRIDVSCEHLPGKKGISVKTDRLGHSFCTVTDSFALTALGEENYTDLLSNLVLLAGKNDRMLHVPNGGLYYVDITGSKKIIDGDIYSLDKVITLIRRGVKETDKRLVKLGRKITPENRVAYLTLGNKERKFKNTWYYYDLGVTDFPRIKSLKRAKITKRKDVEMYAALPDDMFDEYLRLETGDANGLWRAFDPKAGR